MATKIWRGDAPSIAQITTITPATVEVGDTFTITINGKSIIVTATVATAANVCDLFVTAIAASTIPEFGEVDAVSSSGVLTLTAGTAGVPFVVTASASNGGVGGVTVTTTTQGAAAVAAVNMTQTFRIPLSAAGAFQILFSGDIAYLTVGDSAATMETALEALASIGVGNIDVVKTTDTNDSIYELTFKGTFAGINVADVQVIVATTKAPIRTTQEGSATGTVQNEIQTIDMGGGYLTRGDAGVTFTLTLSGQTTSALSQIASASTVQAALIALSNVDAAGVSVTLLVDDQTLQVEFIGTEGDQPQAQMTASVYSSSYAVTVYPAITTTAASAGSAAVDEVQLVTITSSPSGGTFTLTYSGQTTSAIAYNASAATVDAALEALSNIGAGDVVVTGSAGGPWTVTFATALAATNVAQMTGNGASLTGATTETLTAATPTASEGPNHWDTVENWIPSGVPITGDAVRFEIGSTDCLYGLDQTGVTLASLHIAMRFTGKIGLPREADGGYVEYRVQALTLGITDLKVGIGEGSGPSRVYLNTLAVETTIEVRASGGSSEAGISAVTWRGSHASNAVTVLDGDFGTAPYSDQTAVIDTLVQRGGNVALKHTTLNDLLATGQSISAYDCTLSGGPLEL